jgi:hypothetical protein
MGASSSISAVAGTVQKGSGKGSEATKADLQATMKRAAQVKRNLLRLLYYYMSYHYCYFSSQTFSIILLLRRSV